MWLVILPILASLVLVEKRIFIRTFGCQMNEHDSERIASQFLKDGYVLSDTQSDADVVVLNTCCIRENADTKLYGNLGHLKALKDERADLKIVVAGCLAQKDKALIRDRAGWVDLVVGTHNVGSVASLLKRTSLEGPIVEILQESMIDEEFFSSPMSRVKLPFSAYVTVQIGCDNNCSFCIVPSVRGSEISRPFGELLDEVSILAEQGITEITLLGQNVNSYGRDLTLRARKTNEFSVEHLGEAYVASGSQRPMPLFADLLRSVAAVSGIKRVRFISPHPKDLRPETIRAMSEVGQVMNHLHFPLQSGSDRILSAMHRGYNAEKFLSKLRDARAQVEDLAVSTDIIVGFPGETEDDFDATLSVAAEAQFDGAFTYIFSPRPGTQAAEMTADFVAAEVVADRFERLKLVTERTALLKHEARIGRLEEVIVEGPSKRDAEVYSGRTRQNKLVHFAKPALTGSLVRLELGSFVLVDIKSASPHFLRGDFREVVALPSHRRMIPVSAG